MIFSRTISDCDWWWLLYGCRWNTKTCGCHGSTQSQRTKDACLKNTFGKSTLKAIISLSAALWSFNLRHCAAQHLSVKFLKSQTSLNLFLALFTTLIFSDNRCNRCWYNIRANWYLLCNVLPQYLFIIIHNTNVTTKRRLVSEHQ